jgi:F-type H+-transporting ATPase subunit a
MASDILHIKDGYYFEVPKMLWRSNRKSISDFPDWMVRLDADFQKREADAVLEALKDIGTSDSAVESLRADWESWVAESHKHTGWPVHAYLEDYASKVGKKAATWAKKNAPLATDVTEAYIAAHPEVKHQWFFRLQDSPETWNQWLAVKEKIQSREFLDQYRQSESGRSWSDEKIGEYNRALDGKVMIPQPFGTLRNAHEAESGFCISRYMVIEVAVAVLLFVAFRWLAKRVSTGTAPKGKSWNLLEGLVQAVRNNVVVPAMGEHDADRFMPFLWTMFFFILGCNLMGMIPWVGSPTASFGTTAALAALVFIVGLTVGVQALGVLGYLKNICPQLGLPWYLAFWLVPVLWVIEAFSLLIKHLILAVRLLMNMGAGHLVLLGILGIGISAKAAAEMSTGGWMGVAGISILGTTLLSFLEVFVAFLQAYVFTFLAALFIGSSMHHH